MQGNYVFGDWTKSWDSADGRVFVASRPCSGAGMREVGELPVGNIDDGGLGAYVLAFGQDAELELYILTTESRGPTGSTGRVWKLVPRG